MSVSFQTPSHLYEAYLVQRGQTRNPVMSFNDFVISGFAGKAAQSEYLHRQRGSESLVGVKSPPSVDKPARARTEGPEVQKLKCQLDVLKVRNNQQASAIDAASSQKLRLLSQLHPSTAENAEDQAKRMRHIENTLGLTNKVLDDSLRSLGNSRMEFNRRIGAHQAREWETDLRLQSAIEKENENRRVELKLGQALRSQPRRPMEKLASLIHHLNPVAASGHTVLLPRKSQLRSFYGQLKGMDRGEAQKLLQNCTYANEKRDGQSGRVTMLSGTVGQWTRNADGLSQLARPGSFPAHYDESTTRPYHIPKRNLYLKLASKVCRA